MDIVEFKKTMEDVFKQVDKKQKDVAIQLTPPKVFIKTPSGKTFSVLDVKWEMDVDMRKGNLIIRGSVSPLQGSSLTT